MTRTGRVKRIDDRQHQEIVGDNTTIGYGETDEGMKYRSRRNDYENEEYDNYGDYNDGDVRENEDYGSPMNKLRKLVLQKPDATLSVKFYNISYCETGGSSKFRKGSGGRFKDFDNLLRTVFNKISPSYEKKFCLYYIEFSSKGQNLFDAKGQCTFTFQTLRKRTNINRRTNLITSNENAVLDVQGKMRLRLKFLLCKKQNLIQESYGFKTIFFDPQLSLNFNSFKYHVLGISVPQSLPSNITKRMMHIFSTGLVGTRSIEKFVKGLEKKPEYKISNQEISTGAQDEFIFSMFKKYIKETQQDTVRFGFCKAAEALYHFKSKNGDLRVRDEDFDKVRDTARPEMRELFQQALEILQDKADRISEGGDVGKIRNSLMKSLQRLFQEHRRLTGNHEKYYEFENNFEIFKNKFKNKYI